MDNGHPSGLPTGKFLAPFQSFSEGLEAAAKTGPALVSVVTGTYGGAYDNVTIKDISITLQADITLLMPMGDVTLWGKEEVKSMEHL